MYRIMYILRPSDTLGGDKLAAYSHGRHLAEMGCEVIYTPAEPEELKSDIHGIDACIMWSGCAPDWGLPAAKIVKESGKKLIIVPNWWNRDRRQKFFGQTGDIAPGYTEGVRDTLALADTLAVCTISEAQECWKLVDNAQVFLMGQGVGEIFVEPQEPEDYVCCVGRIEPHKNQLMLAVACRILGLRLVLVGPQVNEGYFAWVAGQGCYLTCMGELERLKAQEVLSKARVHALPSFSETPGLSNAESLALGVPAVMGNIGAEKEFYGENGIYCTPEDPQDIANAVKKAWDIKRIEPIVIQSWHEAALRTLQWITENVK